MPLSDKKLAYQRQYQKRRRKSNPEQFRAYKLKESFGITLVQYNEMFVNQNGLCLGCYKHQSEFKRAFAVDHDHITGYIRGLLCFNCNQTLGHTFDSPVILRRLAEYLEVHRATT